MNIQDIKADFQILGYRIVNLNVSNDFIFLDLGSDDINKEIDVKYQLSGPFDFEDDANSIGGAVTLLIEAHIYDGEKQISINLAIEGGFSLNDSRDTNKLKEMLKVNGCAALYSIGRSIIMGATSQMCINGTITIPMVNTFKMSEIAKSDEENDTEKEWKMY